MTDFQRALYNRRGSQLNLSFDLQKSEGSDRVVVGFATLDNVDFGDDIVTAEASLKAFQGFRGNVRLQHDKGRPVGRVLDFMPASYFDEKTGKTYNGIKVAVYISKGAEDVWEMCQDGTLSGFSIGGAVIKASKIYKQDIKKTVQIIDDYALLELSLVDSPMNGEANIQTVFKALEEPTMEKSFDVKNLFYCGVDQIAAESYGNEHSCPSCKEPMVSFGKKNENEDIAKSLENVFKELRQETKGGQSTMSDTTVEIVKDVEGNDEIAEINEAVVEEVEVPDTEIVEEVETEVEEVVETPDAEVEDESTDSEEVAEEKPVENEVDTAELIAQLQAELKAALEASQLVTSKGFEEVKENFETFSKELAAVKQEIAKHEETTSELKEKLNSVSEGIVETQKRLDVVDGNLAIKKSLDTPSQHKVQKESPMTGVFWGSQL